MITFASKKNWIDESTPSQKGYPSIIEPITYLIGCCYPHMVGYTSFSDMGDFYFVGNTYITPAHRGHGLYSRLLSERNEYLHDKPKITLANPIEDTTLEILEQQVAKQGGLAVDTYDEVSDIMKREVYEVLSALPMFVYR